MRLADVSFYFPGLAKYQEVNSTEATSSISSIDVGSWLLTNFATIDEIKEGLKSIKVSNAKFGPFNMVLPLHYIVTEPSGKSLVIEYVDGELHTYDNSIGVLTNSPGFDWHLTNLNNYVNLENKDVKALNVGDLRLKKIGLGSGMLGLPGDFTPPSRFVRMAFFTAYALPVADTNEAVDALFHLLNNFDLPNGSVRAEYQGKPFYDVTQWTSVNDLKNKRFYIKTRDDQDIKMIDLMKFDLNSPSVMKVDLRGKTQIKNVTSLATKFSSRR